MSLRLLGTVELAAMNIINSIEDIVILGSKEEHVPMLKGLIEQVNTMDTDIKDIVKTVFSLLITTILEQEIRLQEFKDRAARAGETK